MQQLLFSDTPPAACGWEAVACPVVECLLGMLHAEWQIGSGGQGWETCTPCSSCRRSHVPASGDAHRQVDACHCGVHGAMANSTAATA
jgi:hypothetical protein